MAELPATSPSSEIGDSLRESIEKRFSKVVGGELRGDKVPDILRSVEKLMFAQTEILGNINQTLKGQLALQRDTIEDKAREDAISGVLDEGSSSGDDGKSIISKVTDQLDMGDGPGGFAKKLGMGLLGAFTAKGFFKTLGGGMLERLGFSKEVAEKGGAAAGTGGFTSVLTGMFTKGGVGAKLKGGVKGFVAGTVGKLVFDAVSSLDADKDGKLLGLDKNVVAGTSAAIAGVGSFVATGKAMDKAGGAIKGALGIGDKATTPKVTSTTGGAKIPGAPTITTSGAAAQGKPTTIKGIASRLPADKALKFAKFFRVAGPLGAVIPALLEPAMAIYNDEPDSVIRKQTAGALGSIGGGALGAIAGGSLGTMLFPGLGSAIGGGLGGLFGAISGEWLIEKMIGAMFDGEDIKEADLKAEAKKNTRVRGGRGRKGKKVETPPPSEAAVAKIGPFNLDTEDGVPRANVVTKDGEVKQMSDSEIIFAMEDGTIGKEEGSRARIGLQERLNARNMTRAGIQSAENQKTLASKAQAISSDQIAKEQTAASIQQNVAKGGDTVTTNTVGGNSTTFNIVKGGGSGSLSNSHLPVLQSSF